MAAGAIETPRLFWLSLRHGGLSSRDVNPDVLGRHLMAHHYPSAVAYFSEPTANFKGPWSTRCLDDLYRAPPGAGFIKGGNLQVVAPTAGAGGDVGPVFVSLGGPIGRAKMAPWGSLDEGAEPGGPLDMHRASMAALWGHDVLTGMVAEDMPQRANGVDLDPEVVDIWGLPVARIQYSPHPMDQAAAASVLPVMGEILQRAGAEVVLTFSITQPGLPPPGVHPMGTMRMGRRPDRARGASSEDSVVDGFGAVRGIPNLFVADGSLMPTATGYNPTLSIQALAWWVAERGVARYLKR
jgi:choline dehydrogenase-like flavoprotein